MMNAFANTIAKSALGGIPLPIFGSVSVLTMWAKNSARSMIPLAPWGFALGVGGMWFIWPAVDPEWKMDMGLMKNPNPPAPPAEAPKLDAAAKEAVANAYKPPPEAAPTEKDIVIAKELKKGEFTTLESEWDTFCAKAIVPGEDDDDDDDDEDDDDDDDDEDEDGDDDE